MIVFENKSNHTNEALCLKDICNHLCGHDFPDGSVFRDEKFDHVIYIKTSSDGNFLVLEIDSGETLISSIDLFTNEHDLENFGDTKVFHIEGASAKLVVKGVEF